MIRGKHETLNRLALNESIHNLRDVRDRDAFVKEVIGFDQDRHAGSALIETARCAHARFASPRAATSPFNALYTSSESLAAQHPFGLSSARRLMQTKR